MLWSEKGSIIEFIENLLYVFIKLYLLLNSPWPLNRKQVIAGTWAICLGLDVAQPAADTCLCFLTVVLRDLQVFNQCQPDPEVKLGVGQQMCWSKFSCLYQSNLVAVTLVTIGADVITIALGTGCSKAAWQNCPMIWMFSSPNVFPHVFGLLLLTGCELFRRIMLWVVYGVWWCIDCRHVELKVQCSLQPRVAAGI